MAAKDVKPGRTFHRYTATNLGVVSQTGVEPMRPISKSEKIIAVWAKKWEESPRLGGQAETLEVERKKRQRFPTIARALIQGKGGNENDLSLG
jgi:hypothetical protein